MKRNIRLTVLILICSLFVPGFIHAQEEQVDYPIAPPFETMVLIDGQTTMNPYKGQKLITIHHRFSQIKEIGDIFGIFGSANTRLGFGYGITDRFMLGVGTTRTNKLQDLEWKYSIFQQTQSGRIPVSLSYYGNIVLDARDAKYFGTEEDFFANSSSFYDKIHFAYPFVTRLSYMQQLIISRNFGGRASFVLAPTFVWYNAVVEGYNNANASLYFGGRLQVLGFHSIIFEYDQPLLQADEKVYPNLALGVEIGTSTHSFRVFASSSNYILRNPSVAFNSRNPFEGDLQFGFNITIRF